MDIGQRVREIRKDLGMSAAELARRTGVARNTIVMIEAGRRTPSLGLVEKIARELRTEPAEFLRGPVTEEGRRRLLAPIPQEAIALNTLFRPKVDNNDFTVEQYEGVGELFTRLDREMADAMSKYSHSGVGASGASEAVREAFNRAWISMDELRRTLQRAYEELVHREEAGVPDLDEFRRRTA